MLSNVIFKMISFFLGGGGVAGRWKMDGGPQTAPEPPFGHLRYHETEHSRDNVGGIACTVVSSLRTARMDAMCTSKREDGFAVEDGRPPRFARKASGPRGTRVHVRLMHIEMLAQTNL